MSIEEAQKKIENMMPTPQQIVESMDQKLQRQKEAIQEFEKTLISFQQSTLSEELDGIKETFDKFIAEAQKFIREHDPCIDESNNLVKIKKGCNYLCLKSGTNLSTGRPSFIKGKIYQAPEDDVLVEEDGSLCDVSEGTDGFRLVE